MIKIDKRRHYYLMLDTETANGLGQPIVYDIGGLVTDKQGRVYEKFSFIVKEVFYGMTDLMQTAYYSNKLPKYREEIRQGKRIVNTYYGIRKYLHELVTKYNIKAIIAYNTPFDYRACTTTQRYLTYSKYRYFFPYGIPLWDALKMAQDTICKQKSYIQYCTNNEYLTKNGRVRATAEIVYRYIKGKQDFIEAHTAQEDTLIEKEIFTHCLRQHKKMRKLAFEPKKE